jgi:sialic acid synthase SpsE
MTQCFIFFALIWDMKKKRQIIKIFQFDFQKGRIFAIQNLVLKRSNFNSNYKLYENIKLGQQN